MLPFLLAGDFYSTCVALPNPAGVTIAGVEIGILPVATDLHPGHPDADDFLGCTSGEEIPVPGVTVGGLPTYTVATPLGCGVDIHIYSRSPDNALILAVETVLGPPPAV